jgi:hypothetical protein
MAQADPALLTTCEEVVVVFGGLRQDGDVFSEVVCDASAASVGDRYHTEDCPGPDREEARD